MLSAVHCRIVVQDFDEGRKNACLQGRGVTQPQYYGEGSTRGGAGLKWLEWNTRNGKRGSNERLTLSSSDKSCCCSCHSESGDSMSMKTESDGDDDADAEEIANMVGMMEGNCNSGICEVQ